MNLIYLANIRFPTEKAHGLQIAKTIDALINSGIKVELVVPNRRSLHYLKASTRSFYQLQHHISITRVYCLDLLYLTRPNTPAVLAQLAFILQSLIFSLSTFIYLLFHHFHSVIYSRNSYIIIPLLVLKRPIFLERHSSSLPTTKPGIFLHQIIYRFVRGVVYTSHALQTNYYRSSITHPHSLIAHNAAVSPSNQARLTQKQSRKQLKLPLNKKIILYTGSFYPHKGIYELAQASTYIKDNAIILFIGGSQIESSTTTFKHYIHRLNHPRIRLLPFQPPAKLSAYLAAADILVVPTNTKKQANLTSSSLKLFTYLPYKKPIIVTDLPAHTEVLSTATAKLVPPNDPQALGQAINHLISSPALAKKIAINSYQLSKQYTWNNRAKTIASFIHHHVNPANS